MHQECASKGRGWHKSRVCLLCLLLDLACRLSWWASALCNAGLPPAAFSEALGCLASLDIPGYDYSQLLRATRLHTFLAELARGDSSAVQSEVVEAVGLLCSDAASAEMLASAGLVSWA